MEYSLLQQFDLEAEEKCECNTCTFKYKHAKLLVILGFVSIIFPFLWLVPLGILGYQRIQYKKSQKVTDFTHHEANRVHTKSQFFYLVITVLIYCILLSFVVLGVLTYRAQHEYDASQIQLIYLN